MHPGPHLNCLLKAWGLCLHNLFIPKSLGWGVLHTRFWTEHIYTHPRYIYLTSTPFPPSLPSSLSSYVGEKAEYKIACAGRVVMVVSDQYSALLAEAPLVQWGNCMVRWGKCVRRDLAAWQLSKSRGEHRAYLPSLQVVNPSLGMLPDGAYVIRLLLYPSFEIPTQDCRAFSECSITPMQIPLRCFLSALYRMSGKFLMRQ